MLGRKTHIYHVFLPNKAAQSGWQRFEKAAVIGQYFSLPAFFVTVLWALFHRMWVVALWLASAHLAVQLASQFHIISSTTATSCMLGIMLVAGIWGQGWRARHVIGKGHSMAGMAYAADETAALRQVIEKIQRGENGLLQAEELAAQSQAGEEPQPA